MYYRRLVNNQQNNNNNKDQNYLFLLWNVWHYLHALALVTKETQNNAKSLDTVFFINFAQLILVTDQRK